MPGGRRCGRKRRVVSFLQPCLLVLLHQNGGHGYSLLSRLEDFGFKMDGLDASLVYRVLRDLEENGLVESEWADDSQGPQRRVYAITPSGEQFLAQWIEDLGRARHEIDQLLAAYERVKEPEWEGGDIR